MKIIHVIDSMSTACGGPARTTLLTVRGANLAGMDTEVLTNETFPGEERVSSEPFIRFLPSSRLKKRWWGYSSVFLKALSDTPVADVYHIQGLWLYSSYIAAKFAREKGRPYLVTLHGALYPEALSHSPFVKKIALFLFQRRQLQQAACIHATCMEEMEYYRSLGLTNPVAVLPCPMECPEKMPSMYSDGVKRIGYLGRVHPRKRVERLIEIWHRLNEPGELLIMGDGDPTYMQFLKKEVDRLKLKRVCFTGFVTGVKKSRLLASLTCLIVPSDFENCGIITPEALLQEIPVIASTGSPWQELDTYRCGWWVKNDIGTLTDTVRKALSLDEATLCEMGQRGRRLILDKYSVDVVSRQMKVLYDWVVGKGEKPDFVFLK